MGVLALCLGLAAAGAAFAQTAQTLVVSPEGSPLSLREALERCREVVENERNDE
jgi:hypothetical protein